MCKPAIFSFCFLISQFVFATFVEDIDTVIYQKQTDQGETLYYVFEPLTSDKEEYWMLYKRYNADMAYESGAISLIAESIKSFKETGSWGRFNDVFDSDNLEYDFFDLIGYEKQYLKNYFINLEKRFSFEGIDRVIKTLKYLDGGVTGFSPTNQTHIAYIAKQPPKYPASMADKNSKNLSFKEYEELFGHIIISVGVTINENEIYYKNRGIFRNAKGFLENSQKNLSLQLHSLTASACAKLYPQIKYLLVRPMKHMGKILQDSFIRNTEIFVGCDAVTAQLKTNDSQAHRDFVFDDSNETNHLILIQALMVKNSF